MDVFLCSRNSDNKNYWEWDKIIETTKQSSQPTKSLGKLLISGYFFALISNIWILFSFELFFWNKKWLIIDYYYFEQLLTWRNSSKISDLQLSSHRKVQSFNPNLFEIHNSNLRRLLKDVDRLWRTIFFSFLQKIFQYPLSYWVKKINNQRWDILINRKVKSLRHHLQGSTEEDSIVRFSNSVSHSFLFIY